MDTYDFAQEQQIMKKIDNQFGVKSQRTDSNVYIWIISNNPRLELTYFSSGTYTIKLDIWDI
ncbi:hypothetical protein [Lacrimispora indolis]|uniref:hypothetical protein n=1 Tax=Lacrimispora indolis TaxID=69825 RepID=UPI000462CDC0|nr:hypothetical protein [[Clostridium] methoxybenzovorans]